WRPQNSIFRRQKPSGQRPRVGVDQPSLWVEPMPALWRIGTVSLKMVKLAGFESWYEDAPQVAPTIGRRIELDDALRIGVANPLLEEPLHAPGATAVDDKLYAAVLQDRPVGERIAELHEPRLGHDGTNRGGQRRRPRSQHGEAKDLEEGG